MTDQEKAQRLLDRASRVMHMAERDLCQAIADNRKMLREEMEDFAVLCDLLSSYLK